MQVPLILPRCSHLDVSVRDTTCYLLMLFIKHFVFQLLFIKYFIFHFLFFQKEHLR